MRMPSRLRAHPSRGRAPPAGASLPRSVRAARTHMILVGSLRKQMPAMFGGEEKQKKLLGRLDKEFEKCQLEHQLPRGDLPNVERYRQILAGFDLNKFPKLERKNIEIMDTVLSQDLPAIMRQFENPF
jgi:EH domain-containing protein 1